MTSCKSFNGVDTFRTAVVISSGHDFKEIFEYVPRTVV